MACRQVSRPSGVRTISTCSAPAAVFSFFRVLLFLFFPHRGLRDVLVQHVHRGLVRGQRVLGGQRREHRGVEPGIQSCAASRAAALSTQPGETGTPSSMAMACAARSAARSRTRSAAPPQHSAPARKTPSPAYAPGGGAANVTVPQHGHAARQRPLGRLPDDLRVNDLRPPRARSLRTIQSGLAAAALRRRIRVLALIRVRIPRQALALMPGCPPRLRPLRRSRSDCCRARRASSPQSAPSSGRPRIRAIHRQTAFQLRQPQLQPPPQLPPGIQLPPQHRVLRVLRLHHGRRRAASSRSCSPVEPGSSGTSPQACST